MRAACLEGPHMGTRPAQGGEEGQGNAMLFTRLQELPASSECCCTALASREACALLEWGLLCCCCGVGSFGSWLAKGMPVRLETLSPYGKAHSPLRGIDGR